MNTTTATVHATNEEILLGIATRAAVARAYEVNGMSSEHLLEELDFTALIEEAELRGLDETHPEAFGNAISGDLTSTVATINN